MFVLLTKFVELQPAEVYTNEDYDEKFKSKEEKDLGGDSGGEEHTNAVADHGENAATVEELTRSLRYLQNTQQVQGAMAAPFALQPGNTQQMQQYPQYPQPQAQSLPPAPPARNKKNRGGAAAGGSGEESAGGKKRRTTHQAPAPLQISNPNSVAQQQQDFQPQQSDGNSMFSPYPGGPDANYASMDQQNLGARQASWGAFPLQSPGPLPIPSPGSLLAAPFSGREPSTNTSQAPWTPSTAGWQESGRARSARAKR